jgi:hypothetical protein
MMHKPQQHGVKLYGDLHTMNVPHKRFETGGCSYFVAIFPEGDMAIHEWNPRYQMGYGESPVTFLMEDGTFQTVKGPFSCNDAFDGGQSKMIRERFGVDAKPTAVRLRVGRKLCRVWGIRDREVLYEEPALSCEPLEPRLRKVLAMEFQDGASPLEIEFEYRGSSCFKRLDGLREEVTDETQKNG